MTETNISSAAAQDAGLALSVQPGDLLLQLIVAFLAPMFLCVSDGDITYARMAAIKTVNAYRAETQADLIIVAQIVAFGLAALGSLSLSMDDNLSLSQILRLRASANACNRSVEQNRKALLAGRTHPNPGPRIDKPVHPMASLTTGQLARKPTAEPPPVAPAVPPPLAPAVPIAKPAQPTTADIDRQWQAAWAASAASIAAEMTAEASELPPDEREAAMFKADLLHKCAEDLLTDASIPHLAPRDVAAAMRSGTL